MVDLQRQLTNEILGAQFGNPFELVNYAIQMAKRMIALGHGIDGAPGIHNQAFQILQRLADGATIAQIEQEAEEEDEDDWDEDEDE